MDDVIVIGAGPAGLAAATYTARHHLKTRVIAPDLAGKAAYRLRLPWLHKPEAIIGEETVELLRQQLLETPQITLDFDGPLKRFEPVSQVRLLTERRRYGERNTPQDDNHADHAVRQVSAVSCAHSGCPGRRRQGISTRQRTRCSSARARRRPRLLDP